MNKKKIKIPPKYNNKIKKVKYSTCNCNNKTQAHKTMIIKQNIDINVFKENKIYRIKYIDNQIQIFIISISILKG